MAGLKVVLDKYEVRNQLLKSDSMKAICKELAEDVAGKCGPGYKVDTYDGRRRVNAMVYPDTEEAKKDNLDNNTLLKALGT